jgi:hypothetical protein
MTTNNDKDSEIAEIVALIDQCIKENKITFLANIIYTLQRDYEEVCQLSTDGEYKPSWTHRMVIDYLTFENRLTS